MASHEKRKEKRKWAAVARRTRTRERDGKMGRSCLTFEGPDAGAFIRRASSLRQVLYAGESKQEKGMINELLDVVRPATGRAASYAMKHSL